MFYLQCKWNYIFYNRKKKCVSSFKILKRTLKICYVTPLICTTHSNMLDLMKMTIFKCITQSTCNGMYTILNTTYIFINNIKGNLII